MRVIFCRKKAILFLALILFTRISWAVTYTVTSSADDGSVGTLRNVINQLNSSGTSGSSSANNTINITSGLSTITLTSNLPVIQNGVTILGPSGTQTISGNNLYSIFATYNASLSLSNLTLSQGLAQGGAGFSGGGGGLGAGGGIYVDLGQTLSVTNVTIQNCLAQGGAGTSVTSNPGGGGGASWTITSSAGTASTGGGDYPGNGLTGGGIAYVTMPAGYGGGDGGSDGTTGTAGVGGGSDAGDNASTNNGGDGGYCGGGGGASDTVNNSAGGGGGNGGGDASTGPSYSGGGGGGYGSGGAGVATGAFGGGGGGGFGGGGGAGSAASGSGSEGGGGGGFGGGGGTGAVAGFGGNFGGDGVANNLGGGGAGIGGAIFVGDSAILQIGSGFASTSNTTLGGAGGNSGTGYANDIFLFQNASVQFVPTVDLAATFAIQGDTNATSANYDAGVSIQASSGVTVTMSSTSNNYQGGTSIQSGILEISAGTLPTTGDVTIASGATLTLMTNTVSTDGDFTNNGDLNIEAVFTPSNYNAFSSAGDIYLPGLGSFGSDVSATGAISIGVDSFGNQNANALTVPNLITANDINVYNTSSITTSGAGSVQGNLYMMESATFSGLNIFGGVLTIGEDSFGNNDNTTTFVASQEIGGFNTINVNYGSLDTNGNALTAVDTAFNVAAGAVAIIDTPILGNGILNLNGTINNSVTDGIGLTGLININSTGVLNSTQNLTFDGLVNCSGTLAVTGGMSTTINGNLYVYNSASLSGELIGGGGSSLIIGEDSLSNTYPSTNSTINSAITNIPTINVNYGTLNANGVITGVSTGLTIASGATAIFGNDVTGSVTLMNNGTLSAYGTITFPDYTSTGATEFILTNQTSFGNIDCSGVADFSSGTVTVTSQFITAIAGNNYSWNVVSASSIIPTAGGITIPNNTVADIWDYQVTATDITVTLQKGQLVPNVPNIGPVITQMSDNPNGESQFILINALGLAATQADLNGYVNQLIPDLNSSSLNVMKQDLVFQQINRRIHAARENIAFTSYSGVSAGEANDSTFWIAPYGSFASQKQIDYNFGYRAYSGGIIFGLDSQINFNNMFGMALARSTTNVQTRLNPGLKTRTDNYYVMAYGEYTFNSFRERYLDWMLLGGWNLNRGDRQIYISGQDFSTDATYHTYQGGLELVYGQTYKHKCFKFTPLGILQYNFIISPPYSENASSPAALNVDNNRWRNVLTLAGGSKIEESFKSNYLTGIGGLYAIVGYDAISSDLATTANFISGSSSFTFVTSPERLSLSLGVDITFDVDSTTQIQLAYEYQVRNKYMASAAFAKLKILF